MDDATTTAPLPTAWPLYFDEDCDADDRRRMLVAELVAFFATAQGARFFAPGRSVRSVGGGCGHSGSDVSFSVDYDDLAAACGSADLVASLEVQPIEGLACLAAAAHEVKGRERERERDERELNERRRRCSSECVTASFSPLRYLGGSSVCSRWYREGSIIQSS